MLEFQMPVHGAEHHIQRCVYIFAVLETKQMVQIVEHLWQEKGE